MELSIVFGWNLDGLKYPETTNAFEFELGGLIVGPARLSQELALRLGLMKPFTPQAVRIAKYMKAARECDDGRQFYSKSLSLDAWSTSSQLLVMRDQLVQTGWKGQILEGSNAKLKALAKLEKDAYPLGSPSETFRDILLHLRSEDSVRLPFKQIHSVTPIRYLPEYWKELLSLLRKHGVSIEESKLTPTASEFTDLEKIQSFLSTRESVSLSEDGSFCLLESDDEYQLAEVTAAWLSSISDLSQILIIRGAPTTILDAYCAIQGLPRLGGHANSTKRSILQILPLALETCWLPADPYRIIELINLQGSPIPAKLGHYFLKSLRIEPGFGGERWSSTWCEVRRQLECDGVTKDDVDCIQANDDSAEKIINDLKFWLEPKRHQPEVGIPAQQAIHICRKIRELTISRWERDVGNSLLGLLANYCHELESTITESGLDRIKKIQLNRMLEAVSGEGCKPENWRAQASEWTLVDQPGQIWASVPIVLWWGFTASDISTSVFDPWTRQDREILRRCCFHVDKVTDGMIREAYSWRLPILNASRQVLLCRPRVSHGDITAHHPIWHEVEEIVNENKIGITVEAHEVLSNSVATVGKQTLEFSAVEKRQPPGARRIWSVPSGKISQRKEESVTSMKLLIECPMSYTLRYHANLHQASLFTVPDGDQLIGDIAHRIFRQLFETNKNSSSIRERAEQLFDDLVYSVGLPLLLHGRNHIREQARRSIAHAAETLQTILQKRKMKVVGCEIHRRKKFGNGEFIGDLDLLLEDEDQRKFVLDYKWSRYTKYKRAEIEEGKQIQLAAYAWLVSNQSDECEKAGYFMIRQQRLISCGSSFSGSVEDYSSSPLQEVWRNACETFDDSIDSLMRGTACARGVSDGDSQSHEEFYRPIDLKPPCKVCIYGNICGVRGGVREQRL